MQAALLEAMEERQVTVAGQRHELPDLFMVLATQNPIEQEGTYPLPEAQMDRFLMHVFIDPPDEDAELEIMRLVRGEERAAEADTSEKDETRIPQEKIFEARREVHQVAAMETIENTSSRSSPPRATPSATARSSVRGFTSAPARAAP